MNTEKQYIQAFNDGYVLEQYEPDFSNIITQNLNATNDYLKGFFAGKRQFVLENTKDPLIELQQLREQSQTHEKSFEK